ncbi:MAG: hypothetical protein ACQCN4_08765 [Candidatus Bathyarchaeia archaeon]|jgi:hypothetical protein
MKKATAFSAAAVLLIIVMAAMFATSNPRTVKAQENQPFHVGVTFGGDNSADAKMLIDRVKDYTNLFVIASGQLQDNVTELEKTCDYAVNSGLDIIVYFSSYESKRNATATFIDAAQQRWGSRFLGIYYSDEPGGRMLDFGMGLYNASSGEHLTKQTGYYSVNQNAEGVYTSITYYYNSRNYQSLGTIGKSVWSNSEPDNIFTTFYPNGTIMWYTSSGKGPIFYQPNGTVTDFHGNPVTDAGDISQFELYSELWDSRPIKEYTDAANYYVATQQDTLGSLRNQSSTELFTSDYGLYWWDYKGGYDTVFAELGWNNTAAQEIGLVRGAANLQGKDWGTIITWTYTQPPYLTSGDEIYDQMRLSYESGAQYVIVFNYAENMTDSYGTLQNEHFQALQRFWDDVVQNSSVAHGGIKAEAALVLPANYGWGMRHLNDTIWGLWDADNTSIQIWTQLQSKLEQYGSKLDIVYEDPAYPVTGKYSQVFYWNQSGEPFITPLIIGLSIAVAIIAVATIIVLRNKRGKSSSAVTKT